MSVESAVSYIKRMRDDEDFRKQMNDASEDEEACWLLARKAGYDFTMIEFKKAQDAVYKEYGVTPM